MLTTPDLQPPISRDVIDPDRIRQANNTCNSVSEEIFHSGNKPVPKQADESKKQKQFHFHIVGEKPANIDPDVEITWFHLASTVSRHHTSQEGCRIVQQSVRSAVGLWQ